MKTHIIRSFLAILLACALSVTAVAAEQHALAGKLIRLHVIANSSDDADQALKLEVRDAVLEAAANMDEQTLSANLDVLREAAERIVRERGYGYDVTAELGIESYGLRKYDTFSLPAGDYMSLRIKIGAAEGKNWWCVLFPPLCFASSEELDTIAEDAGFTESELELIRNDGQDIQIRFRILELIQKLAHFAFD